jgi:thioredoxin-related protein
MKRVLLFATCLLIASAGFAQRGSHRKKASDGAIAAVVDDKAIQWMNIDDVQAAMKKEPRKVWIDVYTDWCGWCKRMDKTTFENPNVVKYMNEHFYAVKLDAEQKEDIRFMGKMFRADPTDRTHPFAKEMLKGQLSYPTSIFMEENFQTPQLIPGYLDVKQMEMILKYVSEGLYKKMPFPEFQANFKPTWAVD